MNTHTSLVASHFRLQKWVQQIQDCRNRPAGMKVEDWCQQHGITKANYYYRLRRVREACLDSMEESNTSFVELPIPVSADFPAKGSLTNSPAAIIHAVNGVTIEIFPGASAEFLTTLIGASAYVK